MISALHKLIPDKVRIPCFITVIAGFVTIVQMLLQAFVPSLYSALGLYLPLIVVNCIILGRAEMFASKNGILDSALDGAGMGLGFTLTLCIMGSIREILGSGTWLAGDWFGLAKGFKGIQLQAAKIRNSFGCDGCSMQSVCSDDKKAAEKKQEGAA